MQKYDLFHLHLFYDVDIENLDNFAVPRDVPVQLAKKILLRTMTCIVLADILEE